MIMKIKNRACQIKTSVEGLTKRMHHVENIILQFQVKISSYRKKYKTKTTMTQNEKKQFIRKTNNSRTVPKEYK